MKLMAIDGNSIINRAYYGIRPLTTRDGLYTHAVFGFLTTLLRLEGEEDGAYVRALRDDLEAFRARRAGRVPTELAALAYPFGYYTRETDELLAAEGIRATFTTEERINNLVPGDSGTLRMMGRFNVTEDLTGWALVERLRERAGIFDR